MLSYLNGKWKRFNFKKTIKLDESICLSKQEVKNNTSSKINLYPYSQITETKPDDVMGLYFTRGFIGVFDGELKEDDYDDIKDKKIVRNSDNGY